MATLLPRSFSIFLYIFLSHVLTCFLQYLYAQFHAAILLYEFSLPSYSICTLSLSLSPTCLSLSLPTRHKCKATIALIIRYYLFVSHFRYSLALPHYFLQSHIFPFNTYTNSLLHILLLSLSYYYTFTL